MIEFLSFCVLAGCLFSAVSFDDFKLVTTHGKIVAN